MAVEDPESHTWLRSKIVEMMKAINSSLLVTVLLLDYGHHFIVDSKKLYALPEFALELWPQAIQFTLHGVLPATLTFNSDINKFIPKSVSKFNFIPTFPIYNFSIEKLA